MFSFITNNHALTVYGKAFYQGLAKGNNHQELYSALELIKYDCLHSNEYSKSYFKSGKEAELKHILLITRTMCLLQIRHKVTY